MVDTTTHDVMVAQTEKAGQLLDYFQGHRDMLEADRVAHAAAVAAEVGNLKGVVNGQMSFTATVDPDELAPTNLEGGTFNTIKDAVEAAPSGALVRLSILPGKIYPIDDSVLAENRNVILQKSGGGNNPVLAPLAYSTGANNAVNCFRFEEGGSLKLVYTDVQFPPKIDAALAWSTDSALIGYHPTASTIFGMTGGTVTGHDGLALMSAFTGKHTAISLNVVTLDGALFAVKGAASGLVLIGKYALTLTNGAQLTDGGAVGTNILQS